MQPYPAVSRKQRPYEGMSWCEDREQTEKGKVVSTLNQTIMSVFWYEHTNMSPRALPLLGGIKVCLQSVRHGHLSASCNVVRR
jgi:hypothetical protein